MHLPLVTALLAVQLFVVSAVGIAADTNAVEPELQPLEPPTNAETERAYKRWITKINAASASHLGSEDAKKVRIEIQGVQQLNCDPVNNQPNSVLCRARVESIVGDAQFETSKIARIHLSRKGSLWVVE